MDENKKLTTNSSAASLVNGENKGEGKGDSKGDDKQSINASKAFEIILKDCGDYHSYQWKLTAISGLCGFFTCLHNMGAVFLAATPDHFCDVPHHHNDNITDIRALLNSSVPWIRGKDGNLEPSKCQYYDQSFPSESNQSHSHLNTSHPNSLEMSNCDSWIYDDQIYRSTVVTEWDLVCDRRWLMSTTQSSFMMGILIGAVFFSSLSDKLGRRTAALICSCLFIISSISVAFTSSFTVFLILRFIVAASGQGMALACYVLLMESVSLKGRNVMGNLSGTPFIAGYFYLSLVAYCIRDWRKLQLAISVPTVILLSYFWMLPESSRWLIMQGREEEGLKLLKTIAKANDKIFPTDEEIKPLLQVITDEIQNKTCLTAAQKLRSAFSNIVDLVRTPNMRKRNLISFYAWFVTSMVYYGLAFSGATLNVSIYLSVTLSAMAEIPAMIGVIFLLFVLGRRTLYAFSFFLGGLSCLAIIFVPTEMVGWSLALATIGKFGISMSFGLAFLLSTELVPTYIRGISVGMSSMFARIGSGIAPYIVDLLGNIYYAIPFIIFGVLTLLAGVLTLFLPETGNRRLPESIEEIEAMPR